MDILLIAGRHAPTPFEPAQAACHGGARLVPFRVVGLGVRAPAPGRKNSLDALLCPLGAKGVAVPSPVCDQAVPQRVDSLFLQGPGLGWGAGRPSRAGTGTAPSIGQDGDSGAEAAPAAPARGRSLFAPSTPSCTFCQVIFRNRRSDAVRGRTYCGGMRSSSGLTLTVRTIYNLAECA